MRIAIKVKWLDGTLTDSIICPEYITFDGFYLEIHFSGENLSCLRLQCTNSFYQTISESLLNTGYYRFISNTAYETLYDEEDSDGSF